MISNLIYPSYGDIKIDGDTYMNKNQIKDFISKACTNLELIEDSDILFYRDKNEHYIEIKFRWPITLKSLIKIITDEYFIKGYDLSRSRLKHRIEKTLKYEN